MRVCTTVSNAASISRSVLAPQDMKLQTDGARRLLQVAQLALGGGKVRVQENADRCRLRHQLTQQPEPLGFQRAGQDADPGDVSARPVEARDEAALDGIAAMAKTIGMVDVAAFAASAAGSPPAAASTVTGRRTSSAASAGSRS